MGWGHLLAFNITLLAAMISPGPALLYALRMSIAGGLRTGIATGAGLGLAAAGWTGAALLGLDALFRLVPWTYLALKTLGALYLLFLAVQMWRHARTPVAAPASAGRRACLGGLMVNLANPKAVLFAASVLVVIFPAGLSTSERTLIVANHFAVEVIAYSAFAALIATPAARAGYLRLKTVFDRIAAGLLGLLGLRLLTDR